MICDFLASFSSCGRRRTAQAGRARGRADVSAPVGDRHQRDPSSAGRSPDTFSRKGRREETA